MISVGKLEGAIEKCKADAFIYLLTEEQIQEKKQNFVIYDLAIKEVIKRKDFLAEKTSIFRIPLFNEAAKNVYLVGLGKEKNISATVVRDSITLALHSAGKQHNTSALILHKGLDEKVFNSKIVSESAELSAYSFDRYKKKQNDDKKFALKTIFIENYDAKLSKQGSAFAQAQLYARDLANEPGNVINPKTFSDLAVKLAAKTKLGCEIWDEKQLKKERMGALLAVGQGSETAPRLIHFTYKHKDAKKKIVFVGKGITFDSGGLDLKGSDNMLGMKGDKSGACAVFAIMKAVSELMPKLEVHGIVAAAENMPSGSACRPGDVVVARNGKSIEITNTDAEGRLILADALCLASELKPDVIIDIATLTGACVVALGRWMAGLFSSDEALTQLLMEASAKSGEPMWPMPTHDEKIAETKKSNIADMLNSATRYGGAIFATMFLGEFVDNAIPWAHIDIAGVDAYDKDWGVYTSGASGFSVRTCLEYITSL